MVGLSRTWQKIPFFDRIKNFFVNVLLDCCYSFLLTNIEKIMGAVETLVEKFKEFKEKFDEVMGFLNEIFVPTHDECCKSYCWSYCKYCYEVSWVFLIMS